MCARLSRQSDCGMVQEGQSLSALRRRGFSWNGGTFISYLPAPGFQELFPTACSTCTHQDQAITYCCRRPYKMRSFQFHITAHLVLMIRCGSPLAFAGLFWLQISLLLSLFKGSKQEHGQDTSLRLELTQFNLGVGWEMEWPIHFNGQLLVLNSYVYGEELVLGKELIDMR